MGRATVSASSPSPSVGRSPVRGQPFNRTLAEEPLLEQSQNYLLKAFYVSFFHFTVH